MSSIDIIELVTLAMVGLVMLMVMITISVKAVRYLTASWYKHHYKRIEPALEKFVLTGEDQPELQLLRPWQRDSFLSKLIVERIVLLRGAGQKSLKQLATDLGLVDKYLKALKSRRRWRRARAAEYLGYFGTERVVSPLGELLSDEDETIRAVAARALARIGSDEAVQLLARTMDDPSELTRLRVAENLERVGQPAVRALSGVLLALGTRGALMATQVLGNLRAREARPALSSALLHTWSEDVRAQATLALGKIGDPDDIPLILSSTKSSSWPVRAQAANALGLIGEVSTIPMLKGLATDTEWWVRLNAAKALANMGPEGEKALLELLQGEDHTARDQVAFTLEIRGITRRMVRQLAKPGKRGERPRIIVDAVIRSGATKYLRDLAKTLPEGEERRILREMLRADDTVDAKAEQMELMKTEPGAEQVSAEPANVELQGTVSECQKPDEPQGGGQ